MKKEKKKLVSEKLRILKMEIYDLYEKVSHQSWNANIRHDCKTLTRHIDLILQDMGVPPEEDDPRRDDYIEYVRTGRLQQYPPSRR